MTITTKETIEDPFTTDYVLGFLTRLKSQVMSINTQSADILESMTVRFLRKEMDAISYPCTLGGMRMNNRLFSMAADPDHGETVRFFLSPTVWLRSKEKVIKPKFM